MVAIENKRFANQVIEQERTKKELEVASLMQSMLFPEKLPSNNRLDVAARYVSKQLVGGDYYDFIPLNNNEYVMCIADVSGKGVGAALLMSNFQAHLRAGRPRNGDTQTTVSPRVKTLRRTASLRLPIRYRLDNASSGRARPKRPRCFARASYERGDPAVLESLPHSAAAVRTDWAEDDPPLASKDRSEHSSR